MISKEGKEVSKDVVQPRQEQEYACSAIQQRGTMPNMKSFVSSAVNKCRQCHFVSNRINYFLVWKYKVKAPWFRTSAFEQYTTKCTLLFLLYIKPRILLEQSMGLLFQGITLLYEIFTNSGPNLPEHFYYTLYKIHFARSYTEEHETLKSMNSF